MHKPVSQKVRQMFASIASRYDITNSVLSLGIHHFWKKTFISKIPHSAPNDIVDLACGTGDLVPILQDRFGKNVSINLTGVDFCEPMLEVARKRFPQFQFVNGDALSLGFADNSLDLVTVSFGVRNFENLDLGLKEIHRVLRHGGVLAVLEFGQPKNILFRSFYQFYSKYIMPIIGGLFTGNKDAYQYLPETAANFPCAEEFNRRLVSAGFAVKDHLTFTLGIAYGYYGVKP